MMNGMSLVISKPWCPMYNLCPRTKINLIPRRLSNLHLQGTTFSVATTHKLKRGPYLLSALKDDGKGGEVPEEVSGVVLRPSSVLLLGVAIIGITLAKSMMAVAQSISTIGGIFKALTVSVVVTFLSEILFGYAAIPYSKPFSIGEIIQVGSVKGRVTNIGLIATSLLGAENVPILVPNSLFPRQGIWNISSALCCTMESKIFVQVDEIDKIDAISAEIINMMKSNSKVYLRKHQPYCYLSCVGEGYCAELTFGCNLKKMCEDKLPLAKQDVLVQAAQIIKKHRATLTQHMGK